MFKRLSDDELRALALEIQAAEDSGYFPESAKIRTYEKQLTGKTSTGALKLFEIQLLILREIARRF